MRLYKLVTSLVLAVGIVGSPALAQTPRKGGTLVATWGGGEPQALFVPAGGGSSPLFTSTKMLEPLVRLEGDMTFSPVLAESVTPATDFLSYTLKLRRGVKWHDGRDFSAEDVKFSAMEYWKPIALGVALKGLVSADVVDPHTVTMRLTSPISEFAFKSILSNALVLPRHVYAGKDIITNPANNNLVGTGPFKLRAWTRGSHLELVRNEAYWNPQQPYLDRLIIRWWRDPASRSAALESGDLGIAAFNAVPVPDLARLTQGGRLQVEKRGYEDATWSTTIDFNQRRPVVNRADVRRALLHAIDRSFIANTIYYKQARPAVGPFPSTNSVFFDKNVPTYPFDVAKAGALLDAAGFPVKNGSRFTVNLLAAAFFEENVKVGQYVKQALEDLQIKVNLDVTDRPTSIKRIYSDYDYDIAISNRVLSIEPVPWLTQFYTTDGIVKGAGWRNSSGYSNPEMDQLVARLAVETDAARRKALALEFAQLVSRDVPIIPLIDMETYTVVRSDVRGHSLSANSMTDSWSRVWLAR